MGLRWAGLVKNVALVLAVSGFLLTVLLGSLVSLTWVRGVWASLLAWMLFPSLFLAGVLLYLLGAWMNRNGASVFPLLPERTLAAAGVGLLILLAGFGLVGIRAYQFSESTAFCAELCHQPMAPERITHQISPHAQVSCSSCHVEHSFRGYLEAKLFGLRELAAVVRGDYPRPIPTPIRHLQPVRTNCTGCHWEGTFWGKVHRDYSHYISSEDNQLWTLRMNVKVGGMYRVGEEGEGIHWHMKLAPRVYYRASDPQLQNIPWVKVVSEEGEEIIFESEDRRLSEEELQRLPIREMTCQDCHNRPAHQLKAPIVLLDEALARGWIKADLPQVKTRAVELLRASYEGLSQQEAAERVREGLLEYYRQSLPDVYQQREEDLHQAAQALARLYRQNFFPQMKADWRAYPDNIGHFLWDGCFRCHDGNHRSQDGRAISNDCRLCHEIVAQGPPGEVEWDSGGGLDFRHPVDFGMPVQELGKCTQCHDGALKP